MCVAALSICFEFQGVSAGELNLIVSIVNTKSSLLLRMTVMLAAYRAFFSPVIVA